MSIINIFPSKYGRTWDQVEEIQNQIQESAKKREETEVFHDPRDAKQLHRQHQLTLTAIRTMKLDISNCRELIAQTEKEVKALQKLEDHYQKLLAKKPKPPDAAQYVVRGTQTADRPDLRTTTQKHIDAANERLLELQKKERNTVQFLKQAEEGLKLFLAAQPRPHLQSNAEMIADHLLTEKLEDEFRRAVSIARDPNAFGFAKE